MNSPKEKGVMKQKSVLGHGHRPVWGAAELGLAWSQPLLGLTFDSSDAYCDPNLF